MSQQMDRVPLSAAEFEILEQKDHADPRVPIAGNGFL
jgi:hypothetical protein